MIVYAIMIENCKGVFLDGIFDDIVKCYDRIRELDKNQKNIGLAWQEINVEKREINLV